MSNNAVIKTNSRCCSDVLWRSASGWDMEEDVERCSLKTVPRFKKNLDWDTSNFHKILEKWFIFFAKFCEKSLKNTLEGIHF